MSTNFVFQTKLASFGLKSLVQCVGSHTWLIHSLHLARSFSVPKVEKRNNLLLTGLTTNVEGIHFRLNVL